MHHQQAHTERVFGLDIFRAAAIILVLLLHSRFILDGTVLKGFPFVKLIDGVELFFVLSGFLIGGILLRKISSDEPFVISSLLSFWRRRWFRTLPGYYLILLVNVVIVRSNIIHEGIHHFNWRYFFFLQNFIHPFVGFYRESWSLSIEEWFYISTPLLILGLLRLAKPKSAFLVATFLMLVFSLLCRVGLMDTSFSRFWVDLSIRKVVVSRFDSIGYGMLAAWLYYYYRVYWDRYRFVSFITGSVSLIAVISYRLPAGSFYSQVIYFTLYPIAAMLLLPLASGIGAVTGIIARAVRHISLISYSMYLINFSLVAEVIRDQFTPTGGIDGIVKYALYWIIVIGGATLLYYGFEKPMMDLRDR